jgi:Ca2+-binding EF-hand superfamily protein
MYRSLLAAVALLISCAAAPGADNPPKKEGAGKLPPAVADLLKGGAEAFIKHFDKNQDGVLTKDELPPRLAMIFDKADANGDGKLDKQEVERLLQVLRTRLGEARNKAGKGGADVDRMVERMLARMDTNKDGKISKDEAQGPLAKLFDRLDANKDGNLDKEELRKAAARLLGERRGKGERRQSGAGSAVLDFDALDKNADGRLTREELKGTPLAAQFDQIDANQDGKIDRKEFEAYFKRQPDKQDK